jgi:nucleoporin p58/p45
VATLIQSDLSSTGEIKGEVDQSVQDTIVATRIIDGFRNSQHSGNYLKNHADFPLEFVAPQHFI